MNETGENYFKFIESVFNKIQTSGNLKTINLLKVLNLHCLNLIFKISKKFQCEMEYLSQNFEKIDKILEKRGKNWPKRGEAWRRFNTEIDKFYSEGDFWNDSHV